MAAGGERREEGGHRRLRPGRGRDGLLEDHGVLGEGVERGRGVAGVAVGAGMVGAQGVHEVDDHEGREPSLLGHRRRAPEGALRLRALFIPARLQNELGRPRVLREVHLGRHPTAIGRVLEGVDEARPHRVLAPAPRGLHHELDPGPFLESLADGAAEAEPRALRQIEAKAQPARRSRGQGPIEDLVHAHGGAEVGEHGFPVEACHPRLDEGLVRGDEVHGPAAGRAGGGPGAKSHDGENAVEADQTPIMEDGSKGGQP